MANNPYSIFDPQIGMNPWLYKSQENALAAHAGVLGEGILTGGSGIPSSTIAGSGLLTNQIANPVNASDIQPGELGSLIGHGKKTFSDTTAGFLMGLATDGTYKWIIGTSGSSVDWNVTTANTLTVAGTITATTGTIGGWTINATTLTGGDTTLNSTGVITLGTGNNIVQLSSVDATYRIWVGHATAASAPFSVTKAGVILSTSGTIGGWNLSSTVLRSGASDAASNVLIDSANSLLRLGPTSGDYITLDGANKRIRSSDYVAGVAGTGFTLEPDLLEVGNISARGIIRTAVFQKNVISSVGGSFAVVDSDKLNVDMSALDASTLTISGNTTFAVNDILRIKDGTDDEWLLVTSAASAPTYTVTRDQAAAYTANNNPAWKNGATVVNYGASGDGLVYMTASDSNAPFLSVLTHAGSPWSTLTTRLRLGNLNGYLGYVADTYGLGIGSSSGTDANITIESTNGIRIRNGTTNKITFDNSGNATLLNLTVGGSLDISTSGNIKSGQSAYNTGAGWFLEYNGGTPRLSIGDGTVNNSLTWDGTTLSVNGSAVSNNDIYGDGNDGNVTISSNTTLTTDMFYNNLTINDTFVLNPNGFRIFVKGTLTYVGTGKIAANGGAGGTGGNGSGGGGGGSGGTAGTAAHSSGSLPASLAGQAGGAGGSTNGSNGAAGTAAVKAMSGAGAAGGDGGGGGHGPSSYTIGTAGAAGSVSGTILNIPRVSISAYFLMDNQPSLANFAIAAGSGSGGGGAAGRDGASNPAGPGGGGGGSGGTGGIAWLAAKTIVTVNGNSYFEAKGAVGGNGGNGATVNNYGGGGGGGGGGGRGGALILIYSSITGTGTTSVTGGSGGSGGTGSFGASGSGGDGTVGSNGGTGFSLSLVV